MKKYLRAFSKSILKIIGITLLSIIGIFLIGVIIVAINSPGRLDPLKDNNGTKIAGSLTEKNWIEIGGIRQGYFIRSENQENPVILFLHGGPGSPSLPFHIPREVSERLEKYFTVVYWEQRGAGISFNRSIDPATMTVEQMIEDTRQMTEYLQRRFNQEKIYLMGNSWETFLGVKTIEKHPENYLAYIGIAQVTNQVESERLAYDFMLKHAMKIGDRRAVRNLQKFDKNAPEFPCLTYIEISRSLMNRYGIGMTHTERLNNFRMGRKILFFRGYTFSEKLNYIRGMSFSIEHLWDNVIDVNLFESSTSFQVPIFIIHGKWDYQVSYTLAREWLEKIEAPEKGFFSFENSAHMPNMDEPENFVQVVRNIVLKISGD